jgi:hypothetical protein
MNDEMNATNNTTNEVAPTKTTMTPQEINRRIAIACGWKLLPNSFPPNSRLWEHPSGKRAYEPDDLPNYHGDLNAMHEAESALGVDQECQFIEHLEQLIRIPENILFGDKPTKKFELNEHGRFAVAHATAAQRAEAFLRTIGQWEEAE